MITIRPAVSADVPSLLDIYAYYVEKTAVTFDLEVPSAEDFAAHMARIRQRYPYFTAEQDGRAVGYAYAGPFHSRAAYDWCCETTIYLSPGCTGLGAGRLLYDSLESALRSMGILNLYACIAVPCETAGKDTVSGSAGDEYLTYNSAQFHEHMGFHENGRFHQCGCKFGRWYDMIWMEKIIGQHNGPQPAVQAFQEP